MKIIKDICDIDTSTIEGKLLMAAIAKITTEIETKKTPYQVIEQLNKLSDLMHQENKEVPLEILVIDLETTGFLCQGAKIVEVGIVTLNLSTGERRILFDKVVKENGISTPEIESSWIVQNSDLTIEKIKEAPLLSSVKYEIQEILNSYPLGATAYNKMFDFDFLEHRGFKIPKKLPCPMILSTNVCKIPNLKSKGYKWPKVEEAYRFFFPDVNYVEKHRGADDALHEAVIVHELYKLGVFKLN